MNKFSELLEKKYATWYLQYYIFFKFELIKKVRELNKKRWIG